MKEIEKWDKEYDVVVAGYGGSGASAAITSAPPVLRSRLGGGSVIFL